MTASTSTTRATAPGRSTLFAQAGGPQSDPQDGILPADFDPGDHEAISVSWFLDYFRATRFVEQFFFFDACRNVDPNISVNGAGQLPIKPADRKTDPFQFIFCSSKPDQETIATGVFTTRLLETLRKGLGSSKQFDEMKRSYHVDWTNFAKYVQEYFAKHRVILPGKGPDGEDDVMQPVYWSTPTSIPIPPDSEHLTTLSEPEVASVNVKLSITGHPIDPQKLWFTLEETQTDRPPIKIPPGRRRTAD